MDQPSYHTEFLSKDMITKNMIKIFEDKYFDNSQFEGMSLETLLKEQDFISSARHLMEKFSDEFYRTQCEDAKVESGRKL